MVWFFGFFLRVNVWISIFFLFKKLDTIYKNNSGVFEKCDCFAYICKQLQQTWDKCFKEIALCEFVILESQFWNMNIIIVIILN